MSAPNLLGEFPYLTWIQMIDYHRNTSATETCDQLRRLFDRFGPLIVRGNWLASADAAGTNYGGASLTQRCGDTAPGSAGRARDNGYPPTQRFCFFAEIGQIYSAHAAADEMVRTWFHIVHSFR
jgi:hypothetical protein